MPSKTLVKICLISLLMTAASTAAEPTIEVTAKSVAESPAKSLPTLEVAQAEDRSPSSQYLEALEARQTSLEENCKSNLPIPQSAEVIFLSASGGTALSTVKTYSENRETQLAQLIIEPDDNPLYIFASATASLIWSVEDDTDRIAGFITDSAVMGLAEQKVDFIPSKCMTYFKREVRGEPGMTGPLFEPIYGRTVDRIVGDGKFDTVALPSLTSLGKERREARLATEKRTGADRTQVTDGLSFSARENYEPAKKTNLYRFYKDGIAYVDPSQVLAPRPISLYDIYPGEAGLSQLLETGHLELIERPGFRKTYRIKKTFDHFPARLNGSHSVTYILGASIVKPGGKLGHSTLIDEATDNCEGPTCPRR